MLALLDFRLCAGRTSAADIAGRRLAEGPDLGLTVRQVGVDELGQELRVIAGDLAEAREDGAIDGRAAHVETSVARSAPTGRTDRTA